MEQTARALNLICRRWQRRRRDRPELQHAAHVIQYHQARNQAAKRSRLRTFHKLR